MICTLLITYGDFRVSFAQIIRFGEMLISDFLKVYWQKLRRVKLEHCKFSSFCLFSLFGLVKYLLLPFPKGYCYTTGKAMTGKAVGKNYIQNTLFLPRITLLKVIKNECR